MKHKDRFGTYDDARKAWNYENCGFYDNAAVFCMWLFADADKTALDVAKDAGLCQ